MKIQYKQKFTINRKAEILSNYDFIYIYIYIYICVCVCVFITLGNISHTKELSDLSLKCNFLNKTEKYFFV